MKNNYLVFVECALQHGETFLIIKRPADKQAGGLLSLPGGTFDEHDEISNCDVLRNTAMREMREELGLDILDELRYVTSTYFVDDRGISVIGVIFHAKLEKTIIKITPKLDEVPEYYWMTQEEIHQASNSTPWLKRYVNLIK